MGKEWRLMQFYICLDYWAVQYSKPLWPLDNIVKILEIPPYNYREVKFQVEYLMKERAKDEFASLEEEQLQ